MTSEEEKYNFYKRILQGTPNVLFVLSARVRRTPKRRLGYTSTAYSDSDPWGMLCGKARVIAAAEVSRYFPEAKIITTTQGPDSSGKLVIDANLMAEELKLLGVPEERIMRETRSTNTLTELQEAVKLVAAQTFSSPVIHTSEYHIGRCRTMYERLEALSNPIDETLRNSLHIVKKNNFTLVFATAEMILPLRSHHYTRLIEKARRAPEYAKRLQSEQAGIAALQAGTYTPTGKTWKISGFQNKTRTGRRRNCP